MDFKIEGSHIFVEQFKELEPKTKRIIEEKLKLIKINPFHFKKLSFPGLLLFRVRFQDANKEKRLIYYIDKPIVKILFILDRKNNYKDLKKYLKKLDYMKNNFINP